MMFSVPVCVCVWALMRFMIVCITILLIYRYVFMSYEHKCVCDGRQQVVLMSQWGEAH